MHVSQSRSWLALRKAFQSCFEITSLWMSWSVHGNGTSEPDVDKILALVGPTKTKYLTSSTVVEHSSLWLSGARRVFNPCRSPGLNLRRDAIRRIQATQSCAFAPSVTLLEAVVSTYMTHRATTLTSATPTTWRVRQGKDRMYIYLWQALILPRLDMVVHPVHWWTW